MRHSGRSQEEEISKITLELKTALLKLLAYSALLNKPTVHLLIWGNQMQGLFY